MAETLTFFASADSLEQPVENIAVAVPKASARATWIEGFMKCSLEEPGPVFNINCHGLPATGSHARRFGLAFWPAGAFAKFVLLAGLKRAEGFISAGWPVNDHLADRPRRTEPDMHAGVVAGAVTLVGVDVAPPGFPTGFNGQAGAHSH